MEDREILDRVWVGYVAHGKHGCVPTGVSLLAWCGLVSASCSNLGACVGWGRGQLVARRAAILIGSCS